MRIEVLRGGTGSWWVVIDGRHISDHRSHEAARIAARNHYIEAVRAAALTGEDDE